MAGLLGYMAQNPQAQMAQDVAAYGGLSSYQPTLRDRVGGWLMDRGLPGSTVQGLVGSRGNAGAGGMGLLDFIPGANVPFAVDEYMRADPTNGDRAMAAIGILPGGKAAKPVVKGVEEAGRRGVAALLDAIRAKYPSVKVDLGGTPETGVVLSRLVVPEKERGRGLGTSVMRDILDGSDAMGAQVNLTPTSDFGGDTARLRRFYKNLGFVDNSGRNKDFGTRETMLRPPRPIKSRSNPRVLGGVAGIAGGAGLLGGLLADPQQAQAQGLAGYMTGGGI